MKKYLFALLMLLFLPLVAFSSTTVIEMAPDHSGHIFLAGFSIFVMVILLSVSQSRR